MNRKSYRLASKLRARPNLALLSALAALSAGSASAATYQWTGVSDSDWANAANWNAPGIIPTGATFAHRLNINNGAAGSEAVYSAALGNTTYTPNDRGLVIGSGALGNGTLRITGGRLSTVGAGGSDAIGNTNNSATLIIDGGDYETGRTLNFGLTFPGVRSTLTVNSGTATIPDFSINNMVGTIDLNGGILAVNRFIHAGGGQTSLNFNGGTLKARASGTDFYSTPVNGNAFAVVKSGGAIIDTSGFDITIGRPLEEDPTSPGGGLTKNGAGTLKLGAPSTITGAVTVNDGGLAFPAGLNSWQPSSLTHAGTSLGIDLGIYNPANPVPLDVTTLTLNAANIAINISGSSIPATSEIKILDYVTKSGSGSLTLNVTSLPSNMVATLEENTTEGYFYLNVTSPSASTFVWFGDSASPGTGAWNTSSPNWNSGLSTYTPPALVSFPSITGGGTVDIVADVEPISTEISNTVGNPYTFSGLGRITGSTGIAKSGTGIAIFNGAAHNYSGPVTISSGAIIKKAADDTTGAISVTADGGTFVLDGGVTDGAGQTLSLNGRGSNTSGFFFTGSAVLRGALQAHNGANTWAGDIVLAGNDANNPNRIGVQNNASLTLTGNISESVPGAGVVFRAGAVNDNITLGGPGNYTYTGRTLLFSNGASILLGANNKLPITTAIVLDSGGATIFDLNGFDQECATLGGAAVGASAARILNNNSSTPSTLTVAPGSGVSGFYQGSLADGSGVLALTKTGLGTHVLASANSYTGTTTIAQGRLDLGSGGTTGALSPASPIVNNGTLAINRSNSITQGTDFANTISGTGGLTKSGAGTLTLTSANTYAGTTVVNGGTLSLTGDGTVGAGSVSLATGTTLDVSASTPATVSLPGGLSGSGTVNATGKTLSIGGTFSPVALAVTGDVSLTSGTATSLVAGATLGATSQATVTGALINDGALSISAGSGLTFADGQSFVFFAASGGVTAGFTSVSVGALALSEGASGVWTGSTDGLTYTYTESSATLSVATATVTLSSLESWRDQFFDSPDNTGDGADQADPDNDGLVNLVEYAIGTDPTAATVNQVVAGRDGNFLTLTYPRRSPADPALTYTVQGSSDLTGGFTTANGSTAAGSPSVYTDDVDVSAPGTRRFLRLSITYTPAP